MAELETIVRGGVLLDAQTSHLEFKKALGGLLELWQHRGARPVELQASGRAAGRHGILAHWVARTRLQLHHLLGSSHIVDSEHVAVLGASRGGRRHALNVVRGLPQPLHAGGNQAFHRLGGLGRLLAGGPHAEEDSRPPESSSRSEPLLRS